MYEFTEEQEISFGIFSLVLNAALIWLYLSDFGLVPSPLH